jgi:hypothetical protein
MDSGQACIKYVREFNNFIAKRMTCETDEVSRYLALFYTILYVVGERYRDPTNNSFLDTSCCAYITQNKSHNSIST